MKRDIVYALGDESEPLRGSSVRKEIASSSHLFFPTTQSDLIHGIR
jgi:hypothetical protein